MGHCHSQTGQIALPHHPLSRSIAWPGASAPSRGARARARSPFGSSPRQDGLEKMVEALRQALRGAEDQNTRMQDEFRAAGGGRKGRAGSGGEVCGHGWLWSEQP